jgi:hypothetical protein
VKRVLVMAACLLLTTCSSLLAQEAPPLGKYQISVKWDAMLMQHVTFETDDFGFFIGLDAYKHVGRNWYVGGAIGGGGSMNVIFLSGGNSITALELNGKRAFPLTSFLVFDLGAGLSYNSVQYDGTWIWESDEVDINEWVFGAQALADMNLKFKGLLVGVNLGYMLTQDVPGVADQTGVKKGWDYSNLCYGVQAGFCIP